ncbi:MAG: hypothetical protein H6651_07880 [Ardenticatenales bacterium]|nr:hypothetical protein [Ardenticatenales bacterium]
MAEAEQLATEWRFCSTEKLVGNGYTPMEIMYYRRWFDHVSVRTKRIALGQSAADHTGCFPANAKDNYSIYFSHDIAQTVLALIATVQKRGDELIDLVGETAVTGQNVS